MLRKSLVIIGFALMVWFDGLQLHVFGLPRAFALPLAAMVALPLVFAQRAPLRAWLIMASTLLGLVVVFGFALDPGYNDVGWPWPVLSMLGFAYVLFLVGQESHRLTTATVGFVTVVADILAAYLFAEMSLLLAGFLLFMTVSLLAWGDSVGERIAAQRALAVEAEHRRRDRQRGAVLEERARIARELHDVVAHHISMIAIQAEAAPLRLEPLSEETRVTFEAIRSASREALTEMRRVLGLLRTDEGDERAPQPRVTDLAELVEGVNRAGVRATLSVVGTPVEPPAGVAVSVYRVVQEALNNAARHAPGAHVEVKVRFESDALAFSVTDSGAGDGAPAGLTTSSLGSGLGLVNMAERVAALGGVFQAGVRPGGGFEVSAQVPIDITGEGR